MSAKNQNNEWVISNEQANEFLNSPIDFKTLIQNCLVVKAKKTTTSSKKKTKTKTFTFSL